MDAFIAVPVVVKVHVAVIVQEIAVAYAMAPVLAVVEGHHICTSSEKNQK